MNNQEQEIIIQSESKEIRIRKVLAIRDSLVNTLSEITIFGWDNNFKLQILREFQPKIYEYIGRVDFSDFTSDELQLCGFSKWNKIYLVPFWLYPFMAYGIQLTCINGNTIIIDKSYTDAENKESYIDSDHRAGVLAYGIIPTE